MRFKITDLVVKNYGTSIVLTLDIPVIFGKAIDALKSVFKPNSEWELVQYKAKRSLKANALLWHYADELAKKLNTTKEHVYKWAIYNVGRYEILETKDVVDKSTGEIIKTKEQVAESFCKKWRMNGLGWFAFQEKFKPEIIHMYYGSSVYDTAEMSRVINHLQDECIRQGIEIRPQEEVNAMLKEWEKQHGKKE